MRALELPAPLRGFLVTTNAIENLIGSTRRTSRNVTRWRSGNMISRWAAIGLLQDALTGRPIGVNGMAKSVIGYIAASIGIQIDVEWGKRRY